MYTIPAWKKNLVPAPHSQACIPTYYLLFSMAMWSWVSQAEIAIKWEDCPIVMCIPVYKEFCGPLMLVYHLVFPYWSGLMRCPERGCSKGCSVSCSLHAWFCAAPQHSGSVQRDGHLESRPNTGINPLSRAVVEAGCPGHPGGKPSVPGSCFSVWGTCVVSELQKKTCTRHEARANSQGGCVFLVITLTSCILLGSEHLVLPLSKGNWGHWSSHRLLGINI